jgi:hypothetical protein
MKKKLVLMMVNCFPFLCLGQNHNEQIDFMSYLTTLQSVRISDYLLNNPSKTTISYIYYELGCVYDKKGSGCLFAIPIREFEVWKIDNRILWEQKTTMQNRNEKYKRAKELLLSKSSKDTLLNNFEMYVFYVKQHDLVSESSFIADDGRKIDDYYPKDDAVIYIYKYKNMDWIEIAKDNINGKTTRTFGENVVEKILKDRFENKVD